jgi:hypothetical protein
LKKARGLTCVDHAQTLWLLPVLLLAGCAPPKIASVMPPLPSPTPSETDAGAELVGVFTDARTPPGGELHTERYLIAKQNAGAMRSTTLGNWVQFFRFPL